MLDRMNEDELQTGRLFWTTWALGLEMGLLIGWIVGIHVADTTTIIAVGELRRA